MNLKKIATLTLFFTLSIPFAYGAEEKSPETAPTQAQEVSTFVAPKDIAEVMAESWCAKMEQCTQSQEMDPKECRKILKKSFLTGFKNIAQGQQVQVERGTLEQCRHSIEKDSCDALRSAQSLPGCSFISLLNRS